ncbi:MAG: hypothetical protein K6A30_00925 [Lachnospiraceae bacterium]|nr:hypothetical protein [Lachnospiraceae bacterium]
MSTKVSFYKGFTSAGLWFLQMKNRITNVKQRKEKELQEVRNEKEHSKSHGAWNGSYDDGR